MKTKREISGYQKLKSENEQLKAEIQALKEKYCPPSTTLPENELPQEAAPIHEPNGGC